MATCKLSSTPPLTSQAEIQKIAMRHLKTAGVFGTLPTPLHELIDCANLEIETDLLPAKERFLSGLPVSVRAAYKAAWQKVLGIADLRERVIYVHDKSGRPRQRFIEGHELGHHMIPWHKLDPGYLDYGHTLDPDTKKEFESEANFYSAEVLFQGPVFRKRSRDFRPEFSSIFHLAHHHETSRHATWRRFIEESDEVLAGIPFWSKQYIVNESGLPILQRGKMVCSPRFRKKYTEIEIPRVIPSGHEWAAARDFAEPISGNISLTLEGASVKFQWEAWWNTYSVFVLLRKRPIAGNLRRLHLIGRGIENS